MPLVLSPHTKINNVKVVAGQHVTATAADVIATGLSHVESLVVSLDDDPVDDCQFVTGKIGANGAVTIKTWKTTSDEDASLAAATAFNKKVNWIAVGY